MNGQTKFVYDKLSSNNIKTVLNIGFRDDSNKTIMNHCITTGKTWTVLEIWEQNCINMAAIGIDVINADVRQISKIQKTYDAIIWLHGPEHILWEEFLVCRKDIEQKANKLVIYQAPIGEYPQEELYGNPYEQHVVSLNSKMFKDLGYQTIDHIENGERTFSAFIEK